MRTIIAHAVFALYLSIMSAGAQVTSPAADEADTSNSSKSAYLRTWVMIPAEVRPKILGDQPTLAEDLSLVYENAEGKLQPIASNLLPYSAGGYAEFTPTKKQLQLVRNGNERLAEAKVDMAPGSFFTVVVRKLNGHYSLSVINDTPKPPPAAAVPGEPPPPPVKQIVFYNFLPEGAMPISSKEGGFSKTIAAGTSETISGLPGKIFNVQMPMKVKKREFIGDTEVDLEANNSLSFLVAQDLYGRAAAFVFPNGKTE